MQESEINWSQILQSLEPDRVFMRSLRVRRERCLLVRDSSRAKCLLGCQYLLAQLGTQFPHTSRYHFAFSPPLAQHCEQKSKRVRNRHRQRKFCGTVSLWRFNRSERVQLTSLADEQKEPNATGDVQEKRHSICRIPEQVRNRVQNTPDFAFHPWRV